MIVLTPLSVFPSQPSTEQCVWEGLVGVVLTPVSPASVRGMARAPGIFAGLLMLSHTNSGDLPVSSLSLLAVFSSSVKLG